MQERHLNRKKYFEELSITSQKYYIPYLTQHFELTPECSILEIGCGDGGNLLPFAQYGCKVTGIDISINRIKQAQDFFLEAGLKAQLIASDIFKIDDFGKLFDIIIMHDVIEHIADKERLLKQLKIYVKDNGIIFIGFPAWQMPFGGAPANLQKQNNFTSSVYPSFAQSNIQNFVKSWKRNPRKSRRAP